MQTLCARVNIAVAHFKLRTQFGEATQVHVNGARAEVVATRKCNSYFPEPAKQRAQHVDTCANAFHKFIRGKELQITVVCNV